MIKSSPEMRILFFSSTFHPTIGGAESYAINVTRGLASLGHEVTVVTDRVIHESSSEKLVANLSIRRLEQYRAGFHAPDRIFWEQMQFGLYDELSCLLSEPPPDIVISNSLDVSVPARVASLHVGCPWVATFHEQAPERDALGEAKLQLAYAVLNPDAVIAGSEFYMARARRFANERVCHLIYHGVDTNHFSDRASSLEVRKYYGVPQENRLLVTAGRLKPRKGFLDVLKAMCWLRTVGKSATLIVAGTLNSASSIYRSDLHEFVRDHGLSKNVVFDEQLTHDRMAWLLSGSDLVVQASLEEGLGLAVIEAMACCRPVVTTRIAGISEIVTDTRLAVLVDPGAPGQLAQAICALLDDDVRRLALGAAGRAHIVENFSINKMVCSTASLFERIVKEGCRDGRR